MPRTVYLVDDDDAFRESARWWLESLDYDVCDFADAGAFAAWLTREKPATECCMLLDVRMPQISGLQLAERLQQQGMQIPTVYVTGHADVPLAVEAMRRGAVTFLEKPLDETALSEALRLAFRTDAAPEDATPAAQEYGRRVSALTPREREVFDLIVAGKINKVIAYDLDISIKTVELHRKRVMEKMGAASLPHLLRMAVTGEASAEER